MRAPTIAILALCALAASAPAKASFGACDPPRRGLALETKQLRVWKAGTKLLGCANGHRRRVLIDQSRTSPPLTIVDGEMPTFAMSPERLAARGTTVAYGAASDAGRYALTGIWSLDLARPVPQVETEDALFDDITAAVFEHPVVVGGLAIGPRGEVAAIICPRAGVSRTLWRTCLRPGFYDSVVLVHPGLPHRVTVLASGRRIDPRSLRRSGGAFEWRVGRTRRRASFRAPAPLREDCARVGRTVARSTGVRILRRELTGVSEARAPLAACLLPHGRVRTIDEGGFAPPQLRPGDPTGGIHVAFQTFAFDYYCSRTSSSSAVAVTGRDPSRIARQWNYAHDLGAGGVLGTPSARRLYVTPAGSAVWSVRSDVVHPCDGDLPHQPVATWILAIEGRGGRRIELAHDAGIDPESLRLDGRRASWLRDGVREHRDLP